MPLADSDRPTILRQLIRWALLLAASLILSELASRAGFSAAFLLGPMLCGIAFGVRGAGIHVPRPLVSFSQATVGCLVAGSLTPSILVSVSRNWLVMLLVLGTTVIAAAFVGWVLAKTRTLPGVTAAWGSSPGAASAMVLISGEFGADVRLVAFMQYLRVLIVVLFASVISAVTSRGSIIPAGAVASGYALPIASFSETLTIAAAGGWVGWRLKIPSGSLLVPMVVGSVLQATGIVEIALPPWWLHGAYAVVGWHVGLRFDRETVGHVVAAIPKLVFSTLSLIALCAISAWLLHRWMAIDSLSAFLATSPSGLDSIAVIATGSRADAPFILAMQTMRLFIVIITGPPIARLISRYA